MKFEWDANKAALNSQKHRITFDEASTVFADPLAAIFDDEWHSVEEDRELIIGYSDRSRLLIVSFTERGDTVRIISARETTSRERRDYEQYQKT